MIKIAARKALRLECDPYFESRGWGYFAKYEAYRRAIEGGEQLYRLRLVNSGDDFLVEPSCSVRIDAIEEIFHLTSGVPPRFHRDSCTLWVEMEFLARRERADCISRIATTEDVGPAATLMTKLFEEHAEKFFAENRTVADVESVLNSTPGKPTPYSSPDRQAAYGLIAAFLVGRTDFEALVGVHREGLARLDRGLYLPDFERLVKELRSRAAEPEPEQVPGDS